MARAIDRTPLVALFALAVAALLGFAAAQSDEAEAGRVIFEETAGGVGCAYCHGNDASGQGEAGVQAANIVGADATRIRNALGSISMMDFIRLSPDEIDAVAAYLAYLANPTPSEPASESAEDASADDDNPASTEIPWITVDIALTEDGFEPATIEIPAGERVRLVVRNRTRIEHHYRVVGLEATDLLWLAEPETEQREGVSDEAHDAHHNNMWVAWRAPSPAGVQPTGDEVHLWAYLYSPGGGRDAMVFTPTTPGTYEVVCPLHPEHSGTVVVTEAP